MTTLQGLRRLAGNRPLAALLAVGGISSVGDWLYLTALPVLVYLATDGDVAVVGLVVATRLVPYALLSLPAGVLADRIDPRRILLLTELARALAMLALAALSFGDTVSIGLVLLVATIASIGATFSVPAQATLVPRLARDDDELGYANAAWATLDSAAAIAGPLMVGVLLLAGAALPLAFVVNGASFAAVGLVLLAVVPSSRPATVTDVASATGADARWSSLVPRLWRALALDGAISFAAGAFTVLAVIIAVERVRGGEAFVGVINAAGGVGGLVGGLVAGLVVNRAGRSPIAVAVVVLSAALAGFAVTTSGLATAGLAMAAFGALLLLDTLNTTAVQRLTADGSTGRAVGLLHTLAAVWIIAGGLVPGLVAEYAGSTAALAATALIVGMLGLLAVAPLPGRRRTLTPATA